jgi:ribosomal protein S18 acetylase RimI-like enzyme
MAESTGFRIRTMKPSDLDQALALSVNEGWNQTRNDWSFFLSDERNSCIVAEHEGKVAGTATALVHDNKVAWIGMVLVDRSLRGQGAGRLLLQDILGRQQNNLSVKLDATPAGEPLYASLGFIPEYRLLRMACEKCTFSGPAVDKNIVRIRENDLDEITVFDDRIFGAGRKSLLNYLMNNRPELSLFISSQDGIRGFVMGRTGTRFTYIGPVEAEKDDDAISLLGGALLSAGTGPLAIDVHEDKTEMISFLESAGFVKQRFFTRMYLNKNPFPGKPGNQYLISGPEFG